MFSAVYQKKAILPGHVVKTLKGRFFVRLDRLSINFACFGMYHSLIFFKVGYCLEGKEPDNDSFCLAHSRSDLSRVLPPPQALKAIC